MKAKTLTALFIAFIAGFAMADIPVVFQGMVTTEKNAPASDISNPDLWGGSAPGPDHDYIVKAGKYCGFGGNGTFGGHSMIVGDIDTASGGWLDCSKAGGTWTYDFGTLVLNRGGIYSVSGGGMITIGGAVTVNGTSASPVQIKNKGASGAEMTFSGAFHGSGCLRVFKDFQLNDQLTVRFTGDMSDFGGVMYIGGDNANWTSYAAGIGYRTPVLIGDTAMGCDVSLTKCGAIGPCGTGTAYTGCFSVPNLTFAADSAIRFSVDSTTGGTIRVTNTLTLPASGKVCLDVRSLPVVNAAVRRHPVLIAPAGTGISANSFRLFGAEDKSGNLNSGAICRLAACSLDVGTDASGNEVLYLVMDKYTYLTATDGYGTSCWLPEYSTRWSGVAADTPLDQDTAYLAYDKRMVTPTSGNEVFGGKRLALSSANSSLQLYMSVDINDFVLAGNAYVLLTANWGARLGGSLKVFDPNGKGTGGQLYVARNYTTTVTSTLHGDGNLTIKGVASQVSQKDGRGTVVLSGTNTAFTGKISVTNEQIDPATNVTLRIADARAVGGSRTAFAYDALSFANWSRLQADASLSLTEPTRGVYFAGGNYVSVPDAASTLTLASQTTLFGTLVKEGEGTLALGGALKFTASQLDAPLAGTNVLQVSAGRIRPASKSGADGLAISFAAGTGLKFAPISEADADVARYGLYDVKWATPFDLTGTGGELNVALDLPESKEEIPRSFTFGICTVPSSAAGALEGNLVLEKVKGYKHSVTSEANGDGTVTFTAKYEKRGFVMLFE